jgi:Galactose oxidase, central domain
MEDEVMKKSKVIVRHQVTLIAAVVALITAILTVPSTTRVASAQAVASSWSYTGNLNTARAGHIATLLPDGKVLVIGGPNAAPGSAELYDPSTGTWSPTGSLTGHGGCPVLLPTGKVLVVGGGGTAELYDPSTGTFTLTGNMTEQVSCSTATLLTNGKVLVTGIIGESSDGPIAATPELYDPSTGTFAATGRFADPGVRSVYGDAGLVGAPATLLPNGKVLIASEPKAELYDPVSGTFSLTGAMTTQRFGFTPSYIEGRTATLLKNGKVLVTGGEHEDFGRFTNAELYDQDTGTFTATGDMTRARDLHTATLLLDGRVLITGGETEECSGPGCLFAGSAASAEIYDPSTGTFTFIGNMNARRSFHTATLLNSGRVLIAGGDYYAGIADFRGVLASAELYNPGSSPKIISALVDGKKLIVIGENFDTGAVILLNGEDQLTKNDSSNPQGTLIGKKAGKQIKPGDKVQVRNLDRVLSLEFTFTGS